MFIRQTEPQSVPRGQNRVGASSSLSIGFFFVARALTVFCGCCAPGLPFLLRNGKGRKKIKKTEIVLFFMPLQGPIVREPYNGLVQATNNRSSENGRELCGDC